MDDKIKEVKALLNSVGIKTFVEHYYDFKRNKDHQKNEDILFAFRKKGENCKESSFSTKAAKGKKIFSEGLELVALEYIVNSKKLPIETVKKAEEILDKESGKATQGTIVDEDEAKSFPEGKDRFYLHRTKERSMKLIETVKKNMYRKDKKLCCQICSFSFIDKYGEAGEGYIEAHHIVPISQLTEEAKTKPEDIALVCSNCHRMLHRRRPWLTKEKLKEIIAEKD